MGYCVQCRFEAYLYGFAIPWEIFSWLLPSSWWPRYGWTISSTNGAGHRSLYLFDNCGFDPPVVVLIVMPEHD